MRCPSCRHELTEGEIVNKALWRLGEAYCEKCIGHFSRGGWWPASEYSAEQYWDSGRNPPGVVTWVARRQ